MSGHPRTKRESLNGADTNEPGVKPNGEQPTGRVELVRRFPFMLQKIRAMEAAKNGG